LDFAFSNEEQAFVKLEAACGTLIKPTVTDRVYTVGPVDFGWEQEDLEDGQIRASASRLSPKKGRKTPGDFSFTTYVKPSGTPGTAPEHDVLFQCLMGTKTIDPGVKVTYSLANQLDSFSIWLKKGHTAFALRGCTVNSAEFGIAGEGIATVRWGCNSMEAKFAGTVTSPANLTAGTTIIQLETGGAAMFVAGMYVQIGTDTNTAAGYLISSVNYNLDRITVATPLATEQGTGATIASWLPTASAEVGTPVLGKLGMVTIAGVDAIIRSAGLSITNNIKYYIDEKNNVLTAERFGRPKMREVNGSLNLYFLKRGVSYFYRSAYQIANALVIPAGNVAGYIMELNVPYAEYKTPKISGEEELIQDLAFMGVASATLNDEMSIVFK
jgi:hypothetical protein